MWHDKSTHSLVIRILKSFPELLELLECMKERNNVKSKNWTPSMGSFEEIFFHKIQESICKFAPSEAVFYRSSYK